MFVNYFKTAWRNLVRSRAFAFINIFGLSLGIICSLLIFLWVMDEYNKDSFNKDHPNTYGVYERVFSNGKVEAGSGTPGLLAQELKRSIPEIRYASGFWNMESESLFSVGERNISMQGSFADSDFFKMFNYNLLEGTSSSALSTPDAIAISRKTAENYFGSSAAAFGKTMRFNNTRDLKVSAVFDNLPSNASQKFDYVLNWKVLLDTAGWLKDWINRSPATFIELQPNVNPLFVEAKVKNFITPYLNLSDGKGFHLELGLQKFSEIYLNAIFRNGRPDGGRIEYVRLFSVVAIFILLIACINFMNLATARSVKRAKEVGIRKTIGALRLGLIMQFIGEAIVLTFFALVISMLVVVLLLPAFNMLTGKQIIIPFSSPIFWAMLTAILVLTGFIAGSYPALFLSSLNPAKVLKGSLKFSPGAVLFRKTLVVFQFVLSIVLIISTIVVSRQVSYIQSKNLGFSKENLLYIPITPGIGTKYPVFKQDLSGMPGIKDITFSNQIPTQTASHVYNLDWAGKLPTTKVVAIHNGVGYDYLKTMNLKLIEGRDFSRDFPTDSNGYIINETALKMIGYKDPIGKPLIFFQHKGTIIGVVKDFNFKSLRDPIEPLVIAFTGENINWNGYVLIKSEAGKTKEAIESVEKVYKRMESRIPFKYFFADESYQRLYGNEQTIKKLSDIFSFLAIFISCLGLLGLTMFTAEQRRKEIGLRKVIGASVADIVRMLSKDIIKLVALSALIATPVAWSAMNNWLQSYAFRIEISWWIFIIAGSVALIIALFTISFQAIKSALDNPIKSLRTE